MTHGDPGPPAEARQTKRQWRCCSFRHDRASADAGCGGGSESAVFMGSLLPPGFLRASPGDLLDAEQTRYERDLKAALEASLRDDDVERDEDVYLAVQAMARMEAGDAGTSKDGDDDDASAASLRSDIESAVAVLAREQANCASRLSKLDAQLSSSSEPPAKLRERHAEASEETAMLARRRDRLERAASELDAMEVALNGSDAPPDERRALREIILHSLLTDLDGGGDEQKRAKADEETERRRRGGGIVSRLLGRRKIAVVDDDEESTFANPNDLGRASGLDARDFSDDFSDDSYDDPERTSGMSDLARASGVGLARPSGGAPRGVDEMQSLLGDIKRMAAKMESESRGNRRGAEEGEGSTDGEPSSSARGAVRSELALFENLRHTLLDIETRKRRSGFRSGSGSGEGSDSFDREAEARADLLADLAREIRGASPADAQSLHEFLEKIDEVLASLSDEREVLRRVDAWPGAKLEAMRELSHLLAELDEMAHAARQWPRLDPNSRALRTSAKAAAVMWACDEERGKISRAADATRRRIESIERTVAADAARFAGHGLRRVDVNASLVSAKHASLTLAERYARVSLLAAERASREDDDGWRGTYGTNGTGRAKARETLASAVRFALRLHELAGGFDASSREALEEVRAILASLDETREED